ncbi:YciI family protein [Agaribacterium haliotis]|uniref:YciI family protein n=1 Tax=Agaribacterium haliotis TaxID=2013869 RepID=UPI000BB53CCE|nr:YciI family protein [Agaribacterium haliotis]
MFIVDLTYIVDLELVEPHMQAHMAWLEQNYQQGVFLASGRKNPRSGGVILASCEDQRQLQKILQQDPFAVNKLVRTNITEVLLNKSAIGLEPLINC